MKRMLAVLSIILAFAMVLTACSGDKTSSDNSVDQTVSDNSVDTASNEPSDDTSSENEEELPGTTKDYVVVQKTAAEKASMKRAKILFMGDSTTAGDGSEGAYRFSAYETLTEAGCFFEFVGSADTVDIRLSDAYRHHLSQGGRTTDQLREVYETDVSGGKIDYDIAVIIIGVNDIYGPTTPEELRVKYRNLLDTMYKDRPDAKIFFSELIWMPDMGDEKQAETDKVIAEVVEEYKGKGHDITLLELKGVTEYDNRNDGHIILFGSQRWHPNYVGNSLIGITVGNALKDAVLEINKQPAREGQANVKDVTGVTLAANAKTLKINEQAKVAYEIAPKDSDVRSVVYTSSDPRIASVDRQGTITAHKTGKAVITARATGTNVKATCDVTVTEETLKREAAGVRQTLLNDTFANADNWATGGEYVTNDRNCTEFRAGWNGNVKAQTKDSFTISKDAGSISFTAIVTGQLETTGAAHFVSMTVGSYELRICNNQAKIMLLYDGKTLGTYKSSWQMHPENKFLINFVDGKVTVFRDNEVLITADAPADAVGTLNIRIPMRAGFVMDDLVIKSGK